MTDSTVPLAQVKYGTVMMWRVRCVDEQWSSLSFYKFEPRSETQASGAANTRLQLERTLAACSESAETLGFSQT